MKRIFCICLIIVIIMVSCLSVVLSLNAEPSEFKQNLIHFNEVFVDILESLDFNNPEKSLNKIHSAENSARIESLKNAYDNMVESYIAEFKDSSTEQNNRRSLVLSSVNSTIKNLEEFVKINEPLKKEDVWDVEFYTSMFSSYYEDHLEGVRNLAVDKIN